MVVGVRPHSRFACRPASGASYAVKWGVRRQSRVRFAADRPFLKYRRSRARHLRAICAQWWGPATLVSGYDRGVIPWQIESGTPSRIKRIDLFNGVFIVDWPNEHYPDPRERSVEMAAGAAKNGQLAPADRPLARFETADDEIERIYSPWPVCEARTSGGEAVVRPPRWCSALGEGEGARFGDGGVDGMQEICVRGQRPPASLFRRACRRARRPACGGATSSRSDSSFRRRARAGRVRWRWCGVGCARPPRSASGSPSARPCSAPLSRDAPG